MKYLLVVVVLFFVAGASPAVAGGDAPELSIGASYGEPIGFRLWDADAGIPRTTMPRIGVLSASVAWRRFSPRTLDIYGVWGAGVGMRLRNDDLTIGRLKIHLFDAGVFYNIRPVTVRRMHRKWDITFGAGAEWRVHDRWTITFDFRMFVPANTIKVLGSYGDFSRAIYREALEGGMLCAGLRYTF